MPKKASENVTDCFVRRRLFPKFVLKENAKACIQSVMRHVTSEEDKQDLDWVLDYIEKN